MSVRTTSLPLLLRIGASDSLEWRIETAGPSRQRTAEAGQPTVSDSGVGELALGLKWKFKDGDEAKSTPDVALIARADLATGSRAFRGEGTRPSLRVSAEWALPGEITIGVVSSPVGGIRWYAERGGGVWRVSTEPVDGTLTSFDGLEAARLTCTTSAELDTSTVLAVPGARFMLGWRSTLAGELTRGNPSNSGTYAYYGAGVAEGSLDATIILAGGPWDFAANVVIVEEAGGDVCNVWGDRRLDTTTMVFTNGKLTDEILKVAERIRPGTHDEPRRDPDWKR